jgi:hypothetical protein
MITGSAHIPARSVRLRAEPTIMAGPAISAHPARHS